MSKKLYKYTLFDKVGCMDTSNLRLLGLSKKERLVLTALQEGVATPLLISRDTGVSRTAAYAILQNLKKRGLVASHIISHGKKQWGLSDEQSLEKALYSMKRELLAIPEGREEVYGLSDGTFIIHRGADAIRMLMDDMFNDHKHERLYGFQGDVSTIGWNKIFSTEETNYFNRAIKKNGLIVEAVLPRGWFEEQSRVLGVDWAKDYEGRAARVNVIDPSYFEHGGQIWIFKNSLYLFDLNEEIVIEIRNSEIQKMILALFRFMQDNSQLIDANELLRKVIAEAESPKSAK